MGKGKYLSGKQLQQALFKRTEGYAANVRAIYNDSLGKIIDIVKGTELEDGVPFSFSEYGFTMRSVQAYRKNGCSPQRITMSWLSLFSVTAPLRITTLQSTF